MRVYDNFLGDVFSTTGAGGVRFESRLITGGSPNFQFVVNAEVWTVVSNGRYGTSVAVLTGGASTSDAFSAGVREDSDFRSNVGCFNDSASTNTVVADVRCVEQPGHHSDAGSASTRGYRRLSQPTCRQAMCASGRPTLRTASRSGEQHDE
jgi:hypothetical protein